MKTISREAWRFDFDIRILSLFEASVIKKIRESELPTGFSRLESTLLCFEFFLSFFPFEKLKWKKKFN